MNKWLKLVTKHKVTKNVVPLGWQTREEVAGQLSCPEERVNSVLKDAINAGEVDAQSFPVWSDTKRKVVPTTCYRIIEPKAPEKRGVGRWPYPVGTRVKRNDSPNLGTVIEGGSIRWDAGQITTPKGSTRSKVVPA